MRRAFQKFIAFICILLCLAGCAANENNRDNGAGVATATAAATTSTAAAVTTTTTTVAATTTVKATTTTTAEATTTTTAETTTATAETTASTTAVTTTAAETTTTTVVTTTTTTAPATETTTAAQTVTEPETQNTEIDVTIISETSETASGAVSAEAIYMKLREAAALPDMFAVPNDVIADYYGIFPGDYSDSIFMMNTDSLKADEIVIIRAVDEEAAKRVAGRLKQRLTDKALEAEVYSPEQFAVINGCTVTQDGLWLSMIVSPDADRLVAAYKNALR